MMFKTKGWRNCTEPTRFSVKMPESLFYRNSPDIRAEKTGLQMSLLFNMLSRVVITFLPRSKHLLISWLQSPSAILEPPKIKSATVFTVSPSICHAYLYPIAPASPENFNWYDTKRLYMWGRGWTRMLQMVNT